MEHRPEGASRHNEAERQDGTGEQAPTVRPQIYVASLSDYNEGRLYGSWIDADQEVDRLEAAVHDLLANSPTGRAEEFGIFDYEGFGPWQLDEYESLETVALVARGISEYGSAFAHWVGVAESTEPEVLDRFEDAYLGQWESVEEFAASYVEDVVDLEKAIDLPSSLASYVVIDYAAMARDFVMSGDIVTSEGDGGVYVFTGNL